MVPGGVGVFLPPKQVNCTERGGDFFIPRPIERGILDVEGRSALTCRVSLQAQLPGASGRLDPGMDVKLAEYVGNVTFYCLFGNVEFIAYLEVGAIGDKQLQHIEFAGGKRFR